MTGRYGATQADRHDEGFRFPCPNCPHTIDGASAEWCQCIVKRPSVVCEGCGACLCKADPAVARRFWLLAPASVVKRSSAERARRAPATTPPAAAPSVDVLVVDDDDEIRTAASLMLQAMGYSVLTAPGGAEALQTIEVTTPRLVLTDALMPRMDGRQLCRLIKAGYCDIRVVIMTSLYTAPRYKYEALKTFQADDYLAKPVDFDRLSKIMRKLLPHSGQEVA